MGSRVSNAVVRFLGFAPFRALFFWLAPLFESLIRMYFFVRTKLRPEGSGIRKGGHYQSIVEDGLRAATADEREVVLGEVFRRIDRSERERMARWIGQATENDGADLLAELVDQALKRSKPEKKQRFFGWLEDKTALDEHSVHYAERIFEWIRGEIAKHRGPLRGLRILELGPGHTLVPGILFYVNGAARYVGVDLFPIAGTDSELYKRLRLHLKDRAPLLPVDLTEARVEALRRFDEVVKVDGPAVVLDEAKVACRYPVDAAKLPFPDGSFDVVFSIASFEHFSDPTAAVRECTRVTAPGGLGLHQIDLRDHRDFTKPLDFLRYEDEEWKALHKDLFCYTNRFRKSDFERAFAESGVRVTDVNVNMKAPFDASLRPQLHPRFRERSQEDLEALSAFFIVKKTEAPAPVAV